MLRPCTALELAFTPSSFMEFAIKLDNPSLVPKALDNFQKIFYSLRMKVVDNSFTKASAHPVIKLPSWINDCKTACEWMSERIKPTSEICGTIAANDRIVVVNSNHAVTDAGFCVQALNHCLDDKLGPIPEVGNVMEDQYKEEIVKALREKPHMVPFTQCTALKVNPNASQLVSENSPSIQITYQIPASKLQCYDHQKKRPKALTESLWASSALSIAAYSPYPIDYLAVPVIFDLRKFCKKTIDWSFGDHVASPTISASIGTSDTLKDVFRKFRSDYDECVRTNRHFYAVSCPVCSDGTRDNSRVYPVVSSIGPIKYNNPISDFHIKSTNSDHKVNGFTIVSFSKVGPNRNDLNIVAHYQPKEISHAMERILIESMKHLLVDVPPDTKITEVISELRDFQGKLKHEYAISD